MVDANHISLYLSLGMYLIQTLFSFLCVYFVCFLSLLMGGDFASTYVPYKRRWLHSLREVRNENENPKDHLSKLDYNEMVWMPN